MPKPPIQQFQVGTDRAGSGMAWDVEWHQCLTSTMDRASDLAATGAREGTVVVADFQAQGRGTRGRSWQAEPGTCLMFTVILQPARPPERLASLPMEVAERVAGVLRDRFALAAQRKPPNDVVIGDRKICGVLCTSRVRSDRVEWATCGVGLNTRLAADTLPVPNATILAIEGVDSPDHRTLLEWLLAALEDLRE